jgi:hypothetical protein
MGRAVNRYRDGDPKLRFRRLRSTGPRDVLTEEVVHKEDKKDGEGKQRGQRT